MEMNITTTVQRTTLCISVAENRFRSENDLPPEQRKQQPCEGDQEN